MAITGRAAESNAAKSPITTPEKASTIANSFGDGLYGKSNYRDSNPSVNNRTIRIQQIDYGSFSPDNDQAIQGTFVPDVNTIEQWELINPIITNISWGDLDYGSDDLVECTLDIKYDWAEYNKGGGQPLTGFKFEEFSR